MNEHVVRILDAATDPDLADDEATRIRERLASAGLLAGPEETQSNAAPSPSSDRLAEARARAGSGTSLSDIVISTR